MKKLKNFFLNLRIRNKLVILFLLIIFFISITLSAFFSTILKNEMLGQAKADQQLLCGQIGQDIEGFQETVKNFSDFLVMQDSVQSFIQIREKTPNQLDYNEYQSYQKSREFLNGFFAVTAGDYFSYITIYGKNGLPYANGSDYNSGGILDYDQVRKSGYYQKAVNLKGHPFWQLVTEDDPLLSYSRNKKVAFIRTIQDTDRFMESGLMILFVDLDMLRKSHVDAFTKDDLGVILLDENNQLLFETDNINFQYSQLTKDASLRFEGGEGNTTLQFGKEKVLVTYTTLEETNWKVLTTISVNSLYQQVEPLLRVSLLIALICVILAFGLSAKMASFVTKPINKLLHSMKRYQEGHFDERVHFYYRDEIGILGNGYDTMAEHIDQLINKTYRLELEERKAELRALQSQINPHFLYNTLDSIFWHAQKMGDKEISETVYALSQFFRLSLNGGKEFIQVNHEKSLLESYLLLQKRRYRQKLDYEIEFDEGILNDQMPKLMLQPLVENSIMHGVLKKENGGKITVKGSFVDGKLTFSVEDNGIGMTEEKLHRLLDFSEQKEMGNQLHGYAIKNIYERLNILYGKDFVFKMESQPGKGTKMFLAFPV